jgi:TolB-like protein
VGYIAVTEPSHAVFLSYASQDAEAAQRICEALRAAGIEVWFDQSALRGGDVWDQAIRKQIKTCVLFIPIVSRHTHERDEGYFRLEWKLAVDRSHLMTTNKAFLLPVVVDDTREDDENVPDRFKDLHWTRLPGGETPPAFVERVRRLVSPEPALRPAQAASTAGPMPRAAETTHKSTRAPWPVKHALLVTLGVLVSGALAYLALYKFWVSKHQVSPPTTQATPAGASHSAFAPPAHSIAVLPFVDLSEKHDQEYFADGMAEEIIDLLARIPGLKVIGRTSSFQFKAKSPDLRAVGSTLGVNYVVEGSVRKSGDQLRVTAQLISAQDGSHLWSETYDKPVGDALKVQDQIAANLVRALQVSVGGADSGYAERRAFKSAEAYDLFLRGLHASDRYDKEGFESALAYFQQALELDPTSVAAAECLAQTQAIIAAFGYVDPAEGFERARQSAQHALALDPKSSLAYATLSAVHLIYEWDWAAAERDAKESLRLEPHDAGNNGNLGDVYRALGRWDESARLYETAISLDPLDPIWHSHLRRVRYLTGRLHEAEAEARKVLQISPTYDSGHSALGFVLLAQGKLDAALAEMQQESGEERDLGLAVVYHALGRRAESDSALSLLVRDHAHDNALQIALVYGYRTELDEAFVWLYRAYRQKDADLWDIRPVQVDPLMKTFTHDPRFAAFLRRMNLPE